MYCCYYHCVIVQLSSGMIEELDSLLHTGAEITAVYKELTKTLPTDHLNFVNVSYLQYNLGALPQSCIL